MVSLLTDGGLDIGDDDIDTLNGHLVELEVIGGEPVVRDDDVRILFRRLDVALERRLRLVFVRLEQLGERLLLIGVLLCVFEDAARQTDVVIGVDEEGEVEHGAQLFSAEDEGTLDDDHITWCHLLL